VALLAAALACGGGAPAAADPLPDLTAATAEMAAALDSVGARPAPWPAAHAGADSSPHRLEYLWVVRWSLTDSLKVEQAVERARDIGVKGLLAQVVGRGDAYYRSDILPRAESLPGGEFDPLGLLIARAHEAGLEVHAWVNCMLVWSLPNRPRDPRHVVNAHPEWIARLADGRPMSSLTARQRRKLGVEGVFLSPAFPGVRGWVGSIVKEIAMRYAVDGVQLDYIRLPGVQLRGESGAAAAGASDPPAKGARRAAAPARVRVPRSDAECAHVSAVVGEVRDSLAGVRSGLTLSAAVLADTAVAERANAQRWTSWLREGLIDRAFAMCYAAPLRTVVAQLLSYAASPMGARVVPGIAVYNTPPATAAAKIKAARARGCSELALYSYDALASKPGYWPSLRNDLDAQGQSPRGAGPGGLR